MSVTPEKDPNYIYAHPYATLIADEYRMRGGYCIVRPGGTDDHLMLLTRAGRGGFSAPRGRGRFIIARNVKNAFVQLWLICQPSFSLQSGDISHYPIAVSTLTRHTYSTL